MTKSTDKILCPECYRGNVRLADEQRHPELYVCEYACCFFHLDNEREKYFFGVNDWDALKLRKSKKYKYMWE